MKISTISILVGGTWIVMASAVMFFGESPLNTPDLIRFYGMLAIGHLWLAQSVIVAYLEKRK